MSPVTRFLLTSAERLLARSDLCVHGYLALCDRTGRVPRNDVGWRHLRNWLRQAEPHMLPPNGRRLLVFATHPRWVDISLALSVILAAGGAEVDFAWLACPTHLPDYPGPLLYRYWLAQARHLHRRFSHPRLRLIALDTVLPAPIEPGMTDDAAAQAVLDASYALRRERLDLRDGSTDREEIARREAANLDAMRRVAALLTTRRYDRMILPSGGILEFGALDRFARRRGLPVTSFEFPAIAGRALIADDQPAISFGTDRAWRREAPHRLSPQDRRRIVEQLVERRQAGGDPDTPNFQRAGMTDPASVRRRLAIPDGRPLVLACANVPFDAIFYASPRRLFAGMWEWLVETVRHLAGRDDCTLVVRAHPAEPMFDPRETAGALLAEAFPQLAPNVRFLGPEAPLNTFAIMQIADLGLVYASTTGLEMAMRGIPVICGNPFQHYNGKGFTIDPTDRADYFARLNAALARSCRMRLTERQIELALCYADLFFNRWPRPFPWQYETFWHDLRRYPVGRFASADGRRRFAEALALFSSGESPA